MRLPIENDAVVGLEADLAGPTVVPSQLLLRVTEAGQILGVCRSTVYELLYAGRIPSVKIGNCRRIRFSDLETFVRDLTEVA